MAIYFSYLPGPLRLIGAVCFPLISLGVLILVRPHRRSVFMFLGIFAVVLTGWFMMAPSNERDWQPDLAILPYATGSGNRITVHNIRNIDYRTETDFSVDHYDRTVDTDKLTSVDLYLVDWGLKHLVHTMVSFGFENRDYICVSIEARKETGEGYSTIKGFFRQYELVYAVADERDLVRLRTNYRQGETVYLYRVKTSRDVGKQIFLDYLKHINRLKEKPEWYNALLGNCTTQIRGHTRPYIGKVWWDWRILANGYIDQLSYELGLLDTSLPFEELKRKSVVNLKAQAADKDPNFSLRIREGLPGMGITG